MYKSSIIYVVILFARNFYRNYSIDEAFFQLLLCRQTNSPLQYTWYWWWCWCRIIFGIFGSRNIRWWIRDNIRVWNILVCCFLVNSKAVNWKIFILNYISVCSGLHPIRLLNLLQSAIFLPRFVVQLRLVICLIKQIDVKASVKTSNFWANISS